MNTPSLRFHRDNGEKYSNPAKLAIADVAPLQRGFDLPTSSMENGKIPVIMSNGIGGYHSVAKQKGPGVITGRSGTIGAVYYSETDYWPHNTTLWVTDFKDNYPKYVYYLYQHINFNRFAAGSGVPTLNRNDVHKYEVLIPSFEEQQKIADFLSTVDEKISLKQKKHDALVEAKKGLLQKIFSQEIRFRKDDGGEYPEWEETPLYSVLDVITDYVAAGSFSDIAAHVEYKSEKNYAQLIRTTDLKNNFSNSDFVYVTEDAFEYLWRVHLDKECVILPNVGNCGEVYYVSPRKLPYAKNVLGPNAILVRSSRNSNLFLSYLFLSSDFQNKLKLLISPTGQRKFNKTELRKIIMPIPCIKEQQKISDFLSTFDEKIETVRKELEGWKTVKKGLLQQMFC